MKLSKSEVLNILSECIDQACVCKQIEKPMSYALLETYKAVQAQESPRRINKHFNNTNIEEGKND